MTLLTATVIEHYARASVARSATVARFGVACTKWMQKRLSLRSATIMSNDPSAFTGSDKKKQKTNGAGWTLAPFTFILYYYLVAVLGDSATYFFTELLILDISAKATLPGGFSFVWKSIFLHIFVV